MQSPFALIRQWCVNLLCWAGLIAAAVVVGVRQGPLYAYPEWMGIAAVLCAVGALLISTQPMGKATIAGRTGYKVVHFGFRAGQGSLVSAALISCMVWCLVGVAAIWVVQGGVTPLRTAMALTWTINVLAVFYIFGIALRNRPRVDSGETPRMPMRLPNSLVKVSTVLLGLTAASVVLWWVMGTPAAQLAALLLAAGPLVVVGGGSGLMLAVMLTVGKNARWN